MEILNSLGILGGFWRELVIMVLFFVIMFFYTKYNYVNRTIGWNIVNSMAQVKNNRTEKDLMLRIKTPSGKESYLPVKQSPKIDYQYKEESKDYKKTVLYDMKAQTYLNGVPILDVSPYDIRPINRYTGLYVNIDPNVTTKLITDSTKNPEKDKEKEKLVKYMLIGGAIIIVGFIVAISYMNTSNTELVGKLAVCYADMGRSVTVIGS